MSTNAPQMPAAFMTTPAAVNYGDRKTIVGPAQAKKFGLLRAAPGTAHLITIKAAGKPTQQIYATARNPANHLDAKTVAVCLSPICSGKAWENERAMRLDHPAPAEMDRAQQVHVFALWSNDPADPKDKNSGALGLIAAPLPLAD